ncbi:MAG: phosphoribosylaminoimidazolesuccinocarboxamide synthase [Chloroflexota bacterium]
MTTDLPLPMFIRGKVRDTYDLGNHLLIIATDRISAFDFILPNGIPRKGFVLNQLSLYWFRHTATMVPNHLLEPVDSVNVLDSYITAAQRFDYPEYLVGRSMIVKKVQRLPVECVARGYISGSAWEEYQQHGTVGGIRLRRGLQESEKLSEPLFTPTTKADSGHDMPLEPGQMEKLVGKEKAAEMALRTLEIYKHAAADALVRGIIIADTKFEFGLDDKKLVLIDEILTPDSSRFWDKALYEPGKSQPSFDKQPVRDWLVQSGWKKEPPVPELPPEVVAETTARYVEAYERLTGRKIVTPA